MKKIKANAAFLCNTMPDDIFIKRSEELNLMKKTNLKQFAETVALGREYPDKIINPGEEDIISNWQYDMFKDMEVDVSISFKQFSDKGLPIQFKMDDAKRFNLVENYDTLKKVKIVELLEDLDTHTPTPVFEEKKSKESRK